MLSFADLGSMPHGPVLDLLLGSPIAVGRLRSLIGDLGGIFYTQVAFRTPAPVSKKSYDENNSMYKVGAEYHLDGQANDSGVRFPDPWTVMIGIALVDLQSDTMGNFTVFKGSHTSQYWGDYPAMKMSQTLPSFPDPTLVMLAAGDAILCHVLLAHRGGKNVSPRSRHDEPRQDTSISHTPLRTREMVFIRVQARDIEYFAQTRSQGVIQAPWCEYLPTVRIVASSNNLPEQVPVLSSNGDDT
jgi:hypothetical protein